MMGSHHSPKLRIAPAMLVLVMPRVHCGWCFPEGGLVLGTGGRHLAGAWGIAGSSFQIPTSWMRTVRPK